MIEVVTCSATNKSSVRLAGSLDVRDANRLQSSLNGLLSEQHSGTVDCSALESLDTACIQLLLSAKRDTRGSVEILFDPASDLGKWIEYAGAKERLQGTVSGQTSGEARS